MSGTQQDEEPDELPEALLDALGLEAQRREYLKRQMLWDANATPELEDLIADDEPVELTPEEEAAVQHDLQIWEDGHAPDVEP